MIVELRTYRTKPGQREAFLAAFEARLVPAHRAQGIRVLGPFRSTDDADTFCWLRGFPDEASRTAMMAAFYASVAWTDDLKGVLVPLLDSHQFVTLADPAVLFRW